MSNRYYKAGPQRGDEVRKLFTTIARRYDLINDIQSLGLHRRWKRRLVDLADVKPSDVCLDLCCGTGDIAFELACRGKMAVGLDFTPAMLEFAAHRQMEKKRHGGPKWVQGDAENIPVPDSSFDVVTVGYGLRNLSSWQRGLEEMWRVVRNETGRIVILEFGKPSNPVLRKFYFAYLRLALPILGKCFAGDSEAYAYIHESLRRYPEENEIARFLSSLGARHVSVERFLGGIMTLHFASK